MLMMNPGIGIELDDTGEFEVDSAEPAADDTDAGYNLDGDTDLNTDQMPPLVSNGKDLATSIAELQRWWLAEECSPDSTMRATTTL